MQTHYGATYMERRRSFTMPTLCSQLNVPKIVVPRLDGDSQNAYFDCKSARFILKLCVKMLRQSQVLISRKHRLKLPNSTNEAS